MRVDKFALVIGVGGAGCNALSYLYSRLQSDDALDYLALNTDMQALSSLPLPVVNKFLIGEKLSSGFGAGTNPENGRQAAQESLNLIHNLIRSNNYRMVFILAGMGGGTGTGAAPMIAEACRKLGLHTFAICSTPFSFEGIARQMRAEEGVARLKACVDNIALFSNDNIINLHESMSFTEAFNFSDRYFALPIEILLSMVKSQGTINIDFSDVITVLKEGKLATIADGIGHGESSVAKAFDNIRESPFFKELEITQAQGILVYVTYNGELTMNAMSALSAELAKFSDKADVIWGLGRDTELVPNEVRISIIVTGIADESEIVEYIGSKELTVEKHYPKEIEDSVLRIKKDFEGKRIAFLIMQFGESRFHEEICQTISNVMAKMGIVVLRADYKEYHPDLYNNIMAYIHAAEFGIAVFERIDDDSFNPNVAFEVGYMLALKKKVCLLKERTLRNLPTDIVGKLYRTFDLTRLEDSLTNSLSRWTADNL